MFGLGFWEIAVVVLLAVTLFPPTEIPKLARSIARAYGTVRRTAEDFRSQIMDDEDLRAPLDEVRSAYNDARWQVSKVQQEARDHLRAAEREARQAVSSTAKATDAPALAQGEHDHDGHDGHDGHEHEDEHDEPASESAPAHAPVGYSGMALEDDEPDPRLASFDEQDDDEDDEDDESDPFAEPSAPRSPIPGPPRGDGSSRAV